MNKQKILIVDDVIDNIDVIKGVLDKEYRVCAATNGERALKIAFSSTPPDLILLDIMMPDLDGFEVCRRLKKNALTRHIPVIFVTARGEIEDESAGFSVGAVDYITKPVNPIIVTARVATHLQLHSQKCLLARQVRERTDELILTRLEMISSLGRAAEYKDDDTGEHVVRMSLYSRLIARHAGLSEEACELILQATPMHDIGKIGIPESILCKPGKLSGEEWEVMKTHPTIGADILGGGHRSDLLHSAVEAAESHHERWDGEGYPRGLKGEEIPLIGRIVAIADVFDALCSRRPYKEPWPVSRAVALIRSEAGGQFDPRLVQAFLSALPEIKEIRNS